MLHVQAKHFLPVCLAFLWFSKLKNVTISILACSYLIPSKFKNCQFNTYERIPKCTRHCCPQGAFSLKLLLCNKEQSQWLIIQTLNTEWLLLTLSEVLFFSNFSFPSLSLEFFLVEVDRSLSLLSLIWSFSFSLFLSFLFLL